MREGMGTESNDRTGRSKWRRENERTSKNLLFAVDAEFGINLILESGE
jgi:hypothetical protein